MFEIYLRSSKNKSISSVIVSIVIGEGNARNFVQLMTQLKSEPVYDYVIVA